MPKSSSKKCIWDSTDLWFFSPECFSLLFNSAMKFLCWCSIFWKFSPRCEIQNEYEIHGNEKSQNIEELATDMSPLKALLVTHFLSSSLHPVARTCMSSLSCLMVMPPLMPLRMTLCQTLRYQHSRYYLKTWEGSFNTAMNNGDWNLAFSETWGPPYDPHRWVATQYGSTSSISFDSPMYIFHSPLTPFFIGPRFFAINMPHFWCFILPLSL